jgi:hypothetical protein
VASNETTSTEAERIARNDAVFRAANEGIRKAADEHQIEGPIPFVCECADPTCRELLRLSLADYAAVRRNPRWFLNATEHHVAAHGWARVVDERDGYVVVEKIGEAGEIAEQLAEGD